MTLYAKNTVVPVERSRAQIELLLSKHKCSQFSTGVDHEHHRARVQFKAHNRVIRFEISIPDMSSTYNRAKNERDERQRWRALLLVIKAKLESVENKIATFEEEFLAHIVLPDNRTVADYVLPAIDRMYATNRMLTAGTPVDADVDAEGVTS